MTQRYQIIIEQLLNDRVPFAVWCAPDEGMFHIIKQSSGEVRVLNDISELENRRGYVVAPFRIGESHPIVMIEPCAADDEMNLPSNEILEADAACTMSQEPLPFSSCSPAYSHCFDTFIDGIKNKGLHKLVLSRSQESKYDVPLPITDIFLAACRKYIHSYTYLCYTPLTGIWMGSTPEVLLSGCHCQWKTVALAGTQPLINGNLPSQWTAKNRMEQNYVDSYIRSQLHSQNINATTKGPVSVYAGALAHLKSEFTFSLSGSVKICKLLKALHPTPAVCGYPKEEAYEFIKQHEGYDRSYYSGFIGWMDTDVQIGLYVNLRCMHIKDKEVTLYAGGGLLSDSMKEDEWQETENKLQTMRRLFTTNLSL